MWSVLILLFTITTATSREFQCPPSEKRPEGSPPLIQRENYCSSCLAFFTSKPASCTSLVSAEDHHTPSTKRKLVNFYVDSPQILQQNQEKDTRISRSKVCLRGQTASNTLLSGAADFGSVCSLAVLWSEYSVATTGCGPYELLDWMERLSYQGVIVVAGGAVFSRIVTGNDLADAAISVSGSLDNVATQKIRVAEWLSLVAVVGAFGALGVQYAVGAKMDGLTGIDVGMCRSMQQLRGEE